LNHLKLKQWFIVNNGAAFWGFSPFEYGLSCSRFRRTCCLHVQGWSV